MRNYISLALATTPSGLGSRCKHVGVPTRLKIGNRLRSIYEASAGWMPWRGRGEELQRAHKKHKYQISVRMQKRNTYNFESAGACFEGWVRGGPRVYYEARVSAVPDRDRYAAWQVPVARTGPRAARGDDIAGG